MTIQRWRLLLNKHVWACGSWAFANNQLIQLWRYFKWSLTLSIWRALKMENGTDNWNTIVKDTCVCMEVILVLLVEEQMMNQRLRGGGGIGPNNNGVGSNNNPEGVLAMPPCNQGNGGRGQGCPVPVICGGSTGREPHRLEMTRNVLPTLSNKWAWWVNLPALRSLLGRMTKIKLWRGKQNFGHEQTSESLQLWKELWRIQLWKIW
jgi:hypothetical protein